MDRIDYHQLLIRGPYELSYPDWEEVIRSVTCLRAALPNKPQTSDRGPGEGDPDAADMPPQTLKETLAADRAIQTLEDILLECSQQWVDVRTRIVKGAEGSFSNSGLRSDYCLKSLRNEIRQRVRKANLLSESPLSVVIYRQVADHIRAMIEKGILIRQPIRTKRGKVIGNLLGLANWEEGWTSRSPRRPLEEVKKELPVILSDGESQAVFEYGKILPTYVPNILDAFGAPLTTSQITAVVIERISPPLSRSEDAETGSMPTLSAEEPFIQKDLWEKFLAILNPTEIKLAKMKEEGRTIDEIAKMLKCSERTVNNLRKRVFEKAQSFFEKTF